jgi:hypothetical protein
VFGLGCDPIRLSLRQAARLSLEHAQEVQAGRLLHLLEPLHRHHRGQGLPLSFDDELVVTEGDSIEEIAESLSDLQRGNSLRHVGSSNRRNYHSS